MGRTQKVIADIIAKELELPQKTGRVFVQRVIDLISDDIVYTGRIELRGLGSFEVIKKPPQIIHHPSTGKPISIPAHKVVDYRASSVLKKRLNKNK
jgi:nucleoid DNA-binding protein